ncbi:multiple sugar transport system substrate-binding protein [Microbacterium halimionae]|uniref:Multiple sugar transport system substrate-binding protein n=1 Tax=Microbacterium halimionae TaxID=1526413 RepID=A0A7W3PM63_9MICO|nr:extracellular solute-binding protein [Microbacterium halimionae]MBA8816746.1 multiple sugar transport system substrate-binding protein [Microbacterium halimionae]NII94958.1 multiple sugar transport system substrate-binding protein [Microbacterium halimionae]
MRRSRMLAVVGAAAVISLTLAGCGRASDSEAGAAEATTLGDAEATGTVTMWAMGAEGEELPAFVSAFEEANPGVTVDVTAIPWDAAHNKFQTAIAAGKTPDIAMMGSTWMSDFSDAFQTVPTDLDTSDFFDSALESATIDDRAVGVPWYVDTRVLYYRTDVAATAGWDSAPTTWDELSQMASDMQTKGGADWGIRLIAGGNDSFQGSLWAPLSSGASLEADDGWTLDTPEMVAGFEYYQSFFADGIADPNAGNASGAQEVAFVNGSTPMLIEGPFERGQLDEIGGDGFSDKYTTAVLPTDESSTSFSGGANLVVFDDAENPTAAWRLAEWLSNADTQTDWFETTGDLPAAQTSWDDAALSSDEKLQPFGEQLKTAVAPPSATTWVQVAAAGDTMVEQITQQRTTPAEGLAALQKTADSLGLG